MVKSSVGRDIASISSRECLVFADPKSRSFLPSSCGLKLLLKLGLLYSSIRFDAVDHDQRTVALAILQGVLTLSDRSPPSAHHAEDLEPLAKG